MLRAQETAPRKGWDSCFRGMGPGAHGSVSPPNLQGQQPVVVGDSVLSRREEAGIDLHVIFVPAETQYIELWRAVWFRASGKDLESLGPGFQPQCCAAYSFV